MQYAFFPALIKGYLLVFNHFKIHQTGNAKKEIQIKNMTPAISPPPSATWSLILLMKFSLAKKLISASNRPTIPKANNKIDTNTSTDASNKENVNIIEIEVKGTENKNKTTR